MILRVFSPRFGRFLPVVFLAAVVAVFVGCPALAQPGFLSPAQVEERLTTLETSHPNVVKRLEIGESATGQPIYALEISAAENPAMQPALLAVAGHDVRHPQAPALLLSTLENWLSEQKQQGYSTLEQRTLYVVPLAAPDAAVRAFAQPAWPVFANTRKTDEDNDGRLDEDGPEDLNENGSIDWMRVWNPVGAFTNAAPELPLPVAATINTPPAERYDLYLEGTDQDGDDNLNEDPLGGVHFHQNFTHQYEPFAPHTGPHPVSEPASRALADFCFARFNIAAVLWVGTQENLINAWKFNEASSNSQLPTTPKKEDAAVYRAISAQYTDSLLQHKKSGVSLFDSDGKGAPLQWSYFHYGRFGFSSPIYLPVFDSLKKDSSWSDELQEFFSLAQTHQNDTLKLLFLKALRAGNLPQIEWTALEEHPDFPGKKVELATPPAAFWFAVANEENLNAAATNHQKLLELLLTQTAQLKLNDLKVYNLGQGVYQVELDVLNTGLLPIIPQIAEGNNWVKKPIVRITLAEGQQLLSTPQQFFLENLPGKGSQRIRFSVAGAGQISLKVGAPQCGFIQRKFVLN